MRTRLGGLATVLTSALLITAVAGPVGAGDPQRFAVFEAFLRHG